MRTLHQINVYIMCSLGISYVLLITMGVVNLANLSSLLRQQK